MHCQQGAHPKTGIHSLCRRKFRNGQLLYKKAIIGLAFLLPGILIAQEKFEPGYVVDNNHNTINGFIKDGYWDNNPTQIVFRRSIDEPLVIYRPEDLIEFGTKGYSRYITSRVKMDMSSDDLDEISSSYGPIWKENLLFLRVVGSGSAILYMYQAHPNVRFFYSMDGGKTIQQLIWRRYKMSTEQIVTDNAFRGQLHSALNCPSLDSRFRNLSYSESGLAKLFSDYNDCVGGKMVTYLEKKAPSRLTFRLKAASVYQDLRARSTLVDYRLRAMSARVGFEVEVAFLPTDRTWSLVFDPSFWDLDNIRCIQVPVGLRRSFFLKDQSAIFVDAFVLMIDLKGSIVSNGHPITLGRSTGICGGIGYKRSRFALEVQYAGTKSIAGDYYGDLTSSFRTLSLSLSIKLGRKPPSGKDPG